MRLKHEAIGILLIALAVSCGGGPDEQATSGDAQAVAAQGQDQLARWFARASPEVLALPDTVLAYIDEAGGRLVFGIEHARAEPAARAALARLGIPDTAFTIEETEPIYQLVTLRDKWRPTINGVQIHFGGYLCSLGFNADHGGDRSFVTASHCTGKQGAVEGTRYYQPTSTVDSTVIATEVEDPTYFRGAPCPRGRKCRYSDSSRALYSTAVASSRGAIARTSGPNNGSLTVTGSFSITSQDNATSSFAVGTTVNKVGRTTGWTQGNVTATCADTNVSGSNITLLCQTLVQNPNGAVVVQGGDSGSGVFQLTGASTARLVGILWGGNGTGTRFVFSPLKQVEDELGALVTTQ
ncbi:S1 family peptidase [Anaeromyxobacter terrae]|uniref:S1 family peptidase n=1 Tax=Anaeromyxobacter terrae TaxID=2925406 RepID=UPI001F599398|nr:S1 family peptidase [Anaeromyxobacter sp. SG22]